MERNQKPQTKTDAQPKRGEVKLHRRYGEIGISAVKAAAVYYPPKGNLNSEENNIPNEAKPTVGRKR